MKSKKLRNYLKWLQQQSYPPYSDTLYRSEDGNTLIHMSYESKRTFMWELVITGDDFEELYGRTELELRYLVDVTNTAKLMKLMGVHDGQGLVKAIKARFGQFESDSSDRLSQFCKSHDVAYDISPY